ncbi:MAG: glycosyltransferase, partial [Defluviitaleaceae bacterium]|nr:glycosyltransferase [Defluviitaleaceae bacterium]
MTKPVPTLGIVVPCYNEEEVLPQTRDALAHELSALISDGLVSDSSFVLFVDDGSADSTWQMIADYTVANKHIKGLKLAANAGHQNALFAGLMQARVLVDCAISIDADLQDDTSVIRD